MLVGRAEVEVDDAVPLPVEERLAVKYVLVAAGVEVTIVEPFAVIVWFCADTVMLPVAVGVPDTTT